MHIILLLGLKHVVLTAAERFENDVIDPAPHEGHVDAHCLQVLAKGGQRPLKAEIVMFCGFVLDEIIVFLVY